MIYIYEYVIFLVIIFNLVFVLIVKDFEILWRVLYFGVIIMKRNWFEKFCWGILLDLCMLNGWRSIEFFYFEGVICILFYICLINIREVVEIFSINSIKG